MTRKFTLKRTRFLTVSKSFLLKIVQRGQYFRENSNTKFIKPKSPSVCMVYHYILVFMLTYTQGF